MTRPVATRLPSGSRSSAAWSRQPPSGSLHRARSGLSPDASRAPADPGRSEPDPIAALEVEHLARLLGRGDLQAEFLQDAADLRHLLGVRLRQCAATDIQAVLQPDAHIATDR